MVFQMRIPLSLIGSPKEQKTFFRDPLCFEDIIREIVIQTKKILKTAQICDLDCNFISFSARAKTNISKPTLISMI